MSVELVRTGWLQLFTQSRTPNMFLSRSFTLKRGGIYNGNKVAIDIERFDEKVAPVVTKFTGPNLNDFSQFTTKEFEPPAYNEGAPIDVTELINRMAGVDPYTAAYTEYASQLVALLARNFAQMDYKIKRAVELQASQILQTATLTLKDADGNTAYTLDFQGKATHFPDAGTAWSDTANADPLADLLALINVIKADGKITPDELYMGDVALNNFLKNDSVKEALDNRRIDIGQIRPEMANSGATFWGFVWVGNYQMQIWGYPETYQDETGATVKYLDDNKVIVKSSRARLDITGARVPLPLGPDPRVSSLMPGRMSSTSEGFDVTPNLYAALNGKQVMAELESRPLLVPVQIDGYGCLNTAP